MKNMNRALIGIIIVLVVVLVALVGWREWAGPTTFTAMYLRTGDLYFGRLVHFPHYGLKQVYLLQVNNENTENPLSVQRFANVFWGPDDFLSINRDEVVWTTTLTSESQLLKLIRENPSLTSQAPQQNPAVQTPQQEVTEPTPLPDANTEQ
jgi:hypothetical protein